MNTIISFINLFLIPATILQEMYPLFVCTSVTPLQAQEWRVVTRFVFLHSRSHKGLRDSDPS